MKDNDNYTCDVCGKSHDKVVAGRWVFYCTNNPKCKEVDYNKTFDNEIQPDIESGDFSYTLSHGLSDDIKE